MEINNILKELLTVSKDAGRVAHCLYGIDFLKPYFITKIEGNFTTKKVLNLITKEGLNIYKSKMCLYVTSKKPYREGTLYLVTLDFDGDFSVDLPKKLWKAGSHKNIDDFFRKSDFNDIRKDETATAYVIAQEKENTTPEKTNIVDRTARFKYIDNETHTAKDGTKYITRVHVIRTDDTGSKYTINDHGQYYYPSQLEKYRELSEIIDKSGYITQDKRNNLKREASRIRIERQRAEFLKTDHTAEIEAITAELEATRDRLADELKSATTYEAIRKTANKIDSWHGLTGSYSSLERIKERVAEKSYISNDDFNKAINNIRKDLVKLNEG